MLVLIYKNNLDKNNIFPHRCLLVVTTSIFARSRIGGVRAATRARIWISVVSHREWQTTQPQSD